jgi:uncharacterized protein (DUF2336 family)
MSSLIPDIGSDQLLDLARDKTVAGRRALIATVTDLFIGSGELLSDRERTLMSEILRQLIHDVEVEVRRALAERLANERRAPRELVLALANAEAEVAHPILLHSEVLQDPDLIEIIHHRTLEHQLAISMRRQVSEQVSDVLVQTGAPDVVKSLLENPHAQISGATLEYLVEQSKRVDTYQNPLLRRPELGPELAKRMYWWVSAALRRHILENFAVDPTEVEDTIEKTVSQLAQRPDDEHEHDRSLALAETLSQSGSITPALLVQALRQGEVALFEALFSKISGIRLRLVRRLLFEPGGEGLAIVCRALGVDPSTFASIFVLSRKARSEETAIAPGEVTRILRFYERTRPDKAAVLLKKWQREHDFLKAVWEVEQPRQSSDASD